MVEWIYSIRDWNGMLTARRLRDTCDLMSARRREKSAAGKGELNYIERVGGLMIAGLMRDLTERFGEEVAIRKLKKLRFKTEAVDFMALLAGIENDGNFSEENKKYLSSLLVVFDVHIVQT